MKVMYRFSRGPSLRGSADSKAVPRSPGSLVLVFGTFDRLHPGHVRFLRHAREKGRRLVVSLARDEFVHSQKGKAPMHSESQRARRLRETGLVSEVYPSDRVPGSFELVRVLRPEVICLGFDQTELERALQEWLRRANLHLRLERLPQYKDGV